MPKSKLSNKTDFLETTVNKKLLALGIILNVFYTIFIIFFIPAGNKVLFFFLSFAQFFFTLQGLAYNYTIWNTDYKAKKSNKFKPFVDVFITVCGEPVEIVEETLKAAISMDYPNFKVYILNDGFVAKKDNWKEIEELAARYNAGCITRQVPGGAKAGNINNGLAKTTSPFFAVFDADHVPHKDFLSKTMGYFYDDRMGFIQTPQYYKNNNQNFIAQAAWDQQALFFGAICKGKNRLNSVFMCGTNMVIRREAIEQAGGMCETNIAEDFLTSLFIHKNKWKSLYVPEVLAEGLAPEDFLSYYNQQFRWARGSLEVIFKYNPLFMRGLSLAQRFQYLASASYYLSGMIILINMLLPLIFMFTGLVPLNISGMKLIAIFIPYMLANILILQSSSNYTYTFKALSFSNSSFYLQIRAVFSVLFNIKTKFSVTSKTKLRGNFIKLVIPHLIYIALIFVGIFIAYRREGLSAALVNNISWASFNMIIFVQFIYAALPKLNFNFKKQLHFNLNKDVTKLELEE